MAKRYKTKSKAVTPAYKIARALYYTMAIGGTAWFKDSNEGKKVRAALHTLHMRKKGRVVFKTKTTKEGTKIWREF